MSERKLVTLRKISEVHPIENADNIERVVIDGWNVVSRKGEFKKGDDCVYFEIDSLLPEEERYEFLRKSSWKPALQKFRLKTAKLRGVISQGLVLPLSSFDLNFSNYNTGDDLTEVLGVEKYEPPIPAELGGDVKGNFPYFIPKTDEERVQNVPDIIARHPNTEFVITEKIDGTSSTFYVKDGEFGFCGRNWEFKLETENTYKKIAGMYNLEEKMSSLSKSIAIQGEIAGPSIQKNKYKLDNHKLFVYHAYDIDNQRYYDHDEFMALCKEIGVETVPVLEIRKLDGIIFDELLAMADGESKLYKTKREGIVIKSRVEKTDPETGRLSFKVISNKFLMKHGE